MGRLTSISSSIVIVHSQSGRVNEFLATFFDGKEKMVGLRFACPTLQKLHAGGNPVAQREAGGGGSIRVRRAARYSARDVSSKRILR